MYAVIARVSVEDTDVARAALPRLRIDLVPKAPGFVNAYWLEPRDGVGMSVIVFETHEQALEASTYPLPELPGVLPLSIEIREVLAHV